jgi:hypothetical protein
MEFTLYYRGELKANGSREDKHRLRTHFHDQLKELWDQTPLNNYKPQLLFPKSADPHVHEGCCSVLRSVSGFNFAPLVSSQIHLVAELKVLLLKPEPPGSIITQCGDIDNRIKTLLDSLKVPETNALPSGAAPTPGYDPFFCLLEDDALITKLAVETDRLLLPVGSRSEVVALVHVKTTQLLILAATIGLA